MNNKSNTSLSNISSISFNNLQIELSNFINNIGYPFISTPICAIGFILNLFSIMTFIRLIKNGTIYKFFLIKTSVESFILLIGSFILYGTCSNCVVFQTIGPAIFRMIFMGYFNTASATMSGFCEIIIALDRLLILKNKFLKPIYYVMMILGALFISLIIPIPFLFANYIREISPYKYALTNTDFGSSWTYSYYIAGVLISLNSFLFIALAILNIFLLYEFKNYITRKFRLTSNGFKFWPTSKSSESSQTNSSSKTITIKSQNGQQEIEKRLTKMVLTLSIIFMTSRLINSISTILSNLDRVNRIRFNAFTTIFSFFSLLFNFIVYGSGLIYHSYFNKVFMDAFKKIFHFN